MSRLQARAFRSPAFWVFTSSIVVAIVANFNSEVLNRSQSWGSETLQDSVVNDGASVSQVSPSGPETLLRESTKLAGIRGQFVLVNSRYEFLEEGSKKPIKCLENQWLQRIVDAQKASTRKITWVVNMSMTEFNDENFLLIENASKSR